MEYYLFIGTAKYTKASPPAKKMLFSSIIITIILPNAMIRIYIILHIYLQVSETEGGGGGGVVAGRTALSGWTELIREIEWFVNVCEKKPR